MDLIIKLFWFFLFPWKVIYQLEDDKNKLIAEKDGERHLS